MSISSESFSDSNSPGSSRCDSSSNSSPPLLVKTPLITILPPCKVCGDKSTGLHYGATTCESCKAFFLRCLRTKRKIKCADDETCQILLRGAKDAKCTKCRYERCLAAGMSKDASKIGRHSHNAKAKLILEARAIEQQKARELQKMKELKEMEEIRAELEDTISLSASSKANSPLQADPNDEEIESIIARITETYYQNTDCTPQFLQGMDLREQRFMEERELEVKMFGERRTVSAEEYIAARRETGLDIDGRQEVVDRLNEIADILAKQLINFGKALPGFSDLHLEDQTSIVKNAARNGTYVILCYKMFNIKKELFHGLGGIIFDREKAYKLYSPEMIDILLPNLHKIYELHLTDEEMVMMAAVCMLLADQYQLRQPQKVEFILDKCLACLTYLLKKNHPKERFMLPQIVTILTEMRTVEYKMGTAKEVQETFNLEFNQLWHEIWNT